MYKCPTALFERILKEARRLFGTALFRFLQCPPALRDAQHEENAEYPQPQA